MSDTPRTDAEALPWEEASFVGSKEVVSADFARQLELELNALQYVPREGIDLSELRYLLSVCRGCDLIYGAHDHGGYGIGQKVFGVTITDQTNVADIVDAVIKTLPCRHEWSEGKPGWPSRCYKCGLNAGDISGPLERKE